MVVICIFFSLVAWKKNIPSPPPSYRNTAFSLTLDVTSTDMQMQKTSLGIFSIYLMRPSKTLSNISETVFSLALSMTSIYRVFFRFGNKTQLPTPPHTHSPACMYFSNCSRLCSTSAGVRVKIFFGGKVGAMLLPYSFFICQQTRVILSSCFIWFISSCLWIAAADVWSD